MKRTTKWLIGIVCLAGISIALVILLRSRPERISPQKFEQVFEEITSLEVSISSLTPDFGGKTLAYVHSTDEGRGVALLNLETGTRQELPTTNEVIQICGWSLDDRYLAFLQMASRALPKKGGLRETWVTLYDRQTDSVRRLTNEKDIYETYFFWLGTNEFMYSRRVLTNDFGEFVTGNINQGNFKKVSNFIPEGTIMSSNCAGFLYHGNIVSLGIKPMSESELKDSKSTAKLRTLTEFKPEDFTQMKWLRYSPYKNRFLFCGRRAKSTWRYLYEFDPETKKLEQISQMDTYNGQYLQKGKGYAYVANPSNSFYLAIRPENPAEHTNLFTKGSVVSYAADQAGEKVFVHGSIGDEPQGVWEYDLKTRLLRPLVGTARNFVASQVIDPEVLKIESFDGLQVPCILLDPPVAVKKGSRCVLSRLVPGAKYPAVIYIPPPSSQMQKAFGPRSQFLANIGFYFLAVNYRGVDGYGKEYSALADLQGAVQDVLAARDWLIANRNVDPKNIFIFSMSGGTPVCAELLATAPDLWRGVAIDKPSGTLCSHRLVPSQFPPCLLITGDMDASAGDVRKFAAWAASNHIDVTTFIYTNAAHITFDLNSRKRSQREVAEFYLKNLQ